MVHFILKGSSLSIRSLNLQISEENCKKIANDFADDTSKSQIGILLPKLFWPTVRKNCSSDREFFLILLEQFVQTLKGLNKLLGFRNMQEKLEKHSVTRNCSDLSLFE